MNSVDLVPLRSNMNNVMTKLIRHWNITAPFNQIFDDLIVTPERSKVNSSQPFYILKIDEVFFWDRLLCYTLSIIFWSIKLFLIFCKYNIKNHIDWSRRVILTCIMQHGLLAFLLNRPIEISWILRKQPLQLLIMPEFNGLDCFLKYLLNSRSCCNLI